MLPVAAAITGVLILGAIGVQSSLESNDDAGRARLLAQLANATAEVLHVGQDEVGETAISHEKDGKPFKNSYQAAIQATDQAVADYNEVSDRVKEQVPELSSVLTTAGGALDQLIDARDALSEYASDADLPLSDPDTKSGFEVYRSIAARLLDVADALHVHIEDRDLAEQARAVAALAGAKQATAEQRYLVQNELGVEAAGGDAFTLSRLTELALYVGVEQQRLGEFYRATTPRGKSLYIDATSGRDSQTSEKILDALLNGKGLSDDDARSWDAVQSERTDRLREVESAITKDLDDSAVREESESQQMAVFTAAAVLAIALFAFGAATLFAFRVGKRLQSLRNEALTAAEETLPDAVSQMTRARNGRQIDEAVEAAEEVSRSAPRGPYDEIGAVAQAFRVVHQQAVRMAADQANLRLDVAAMMISLARRGQSLVQRQLQVLTEFGRAAAHPDTVRRIDSLNHLAARMRRNEENLLLLAGGDPGRRHSQATSVARIVAEAAAEIEDSDRVIVEGIADTAIVANAVGDVVHLLAELLENAAQFSAPHTKVRVTTRHTVHELVISVSDEGIGLTDEDVTEINARLASPAGLTAKLAGTLGLLVVGRLATGHEIDVQLHSSSGKGTLAMVRIPDALVSRDRAPEQQLPPTRPQAPLALASEPAAAPIAGAGRPVATDAIVPTQRTASSSRPGTAARPPANSAWFMPHTGSGDSPSTKQGTLGWRETAADVAYDKARRVIAEQAAAQTTLTDGLPRRSPGAQLLPGSVSVPAAPSRSSDRSRIDGIDPEEIRNRLSGFAGGIAAARQSSSIVDNRPQPGDR
ncbi:Histidine kinase [Stackebrandtia soli]